MKITRAWYLVFFLLLAITSIRPVDAAVFTYYYIAGGWTPASASTATGYCSAISGTYSAGGTNGICTTPNGNGYFIQSGSAECGQYVFDYAIRLCSTTVLNNPPPPPDPCASEPPKTVILDVTYTNGVPNIPQTYTAACGDMVLSGSAGGSGTTIEAACDGVSKCLVTYAPSSSTQASTGGSCPSGQLDVGVGCQSFANAKAFILATESKFIYSTTAAEDAVAAVNATGGSLAAQTAAASAAQQAISIGLTPSQAVQLGQAAGYAVDAGTPPSTAISDAIGGAVKSMPANVTQSNQLSDYCKVHPSALSCVEVTPAPIAGNAPTGTVDVSNTNFFAEVFTGNASCPSPRSITLHHGGTQLFSYQPLCDFFGIFSYVATAVSLYIAGMIMFGQKTTALE